MSIADKIMTIANNTPSVCEVVNSAVTKVSGEIISVNDVNRPEHNLVVKVNSKNLFEKDKASDFNNWSKLDNSYYSIPIYVGKGNTVTISYSQTLSIGLGFYTAVMTTNNTATNVTTWIYHNGATSLIKNKATITATEDNIYIRHNMNSSNYSTNLPLFMQYIGNDLQIEIGSTATSYTPYIEELNGVNVSRCGKNLATAQEIYTGNTSYGVVEFEGRTCVRFVDNKAIHYDNIPFKPNTQYTVSFEARITKREEIEGTSGLFYFMYSDGTYTRLVGARNTEFEYFTCTSKAGKTVVSAGTNTHHYVNYNYIDVNSFQLEEGAIETEYEPYTKQTATANADGTVEGLTSLSPNMTLTTDKEGVIIKCEYLTEENQIIRDKFLNLESAFATAKGIIKNYRRISCLN